MKRSPQENIAAVEAAMQAVLEHPMCGKFEDLDGYYRVYYPDGTSWLGGIQVACTGCGKCVALERMLAKMETHYQEGQIWYRRFGS